MLKLFIGMVAVCLMSFAAPVGDGSTTGQKTTMSNQDSSKTAEGDHERRSDDTSGAERTPMESTADKPNYKHGAQSERRPRDWEKVLALVSTLTNLGLFILGAIGACLVYRQLRITEESNLSAARDTERTLELMAKTLEETKNQRIQSAKDAEVSRLQSMRDSEALRAQSEAHAFSALEATRESNEMTRLSNRIATEGMRISRMVYLNEHRPQIFAIGVEVDDNGPWMTAKVRFKNRGKAAALDAHFSGAIAISDPQEDPFAYDRWTLDWWSGRNSLQTTLEPQEEILFEIFPRRAFTAEEMEQIAKKEKTLYVLGYVHPWRNHFNHRQEHLYFCYQRFVYDSNPGEWIPGFSHNETEYDKFLFETIAEDPKAPRETVPYIRDPLLDPPLPEERALP